MNTVERLLDALHSGWQANPSDLVDAEWCWVTEARHPHTYGPTGTIHREHCTRIDHHTTYLRPVGPNDAIVRRCDNCGGRGVA